MRPKELTALPTTHQSKGQAQHETAVKRVKETPRHFVSADELVAYLYPTAEEDAGRELPGHIIRLPAEKWPRTKEKPE